MRQIMKHKDVGLLNKKMSFFNNCEWHSGEPHITRHFYYEDNEITKIVFEEITPYFAGDRSLDDVIKYLNDRTTKYIREM